MHRSIPSALAACLALASHALSQTTTTVHVSSGGVPGNENAHFPAVSADGRFVAYYSKAANLVTGDFAFRDDVFVHDRASGLTERVNLGPGGVEGNHNSRHPTISDDGNRVAFWSQASNLVVGDTNGWEDVFVHDRNTGTTTRVSVGPGGAQADFNSYFPKISGDGSVVAFWSSASNLVRNGVTAVGGIFAHVLATGDTELVSVNLSGQGSAGGTFFVDPAATQNVSFDGRYVVFISTANDLVLGDSNIGFDVFVRDRLLGTTMRANTDAAGAQAIQSNPSAGSVNASISGDGGFVLFRSDAANLVGGDTNGQADLFVKQLASGAIEIASLTGTGLQATGFTFWGGDLSDDGRYVLFETSFPFTADDLNSVDDVFLRDRLLDTTVLVSQSTTGDKTTTDQYPHASFVLSGDGRTAVFESGDYNLTSPETQPFIDVYVRDLTLTAPVTSYCSSKSNSADCQPLISSAGAPTLSGFDAFFLAASRELNNKFGLFFWGLSPASLPFGGGTLCVQPPIVRTPVQVSGGSPAGTDCSGSYSFHFGQAYLAAEGLGAGTAVYAQAWGRDPGFAAPNNLSLTQALTFIVTP